ncbi:MAG: hypothetical protein U1E14_19850 [Geminicoccaceae bacterium]
MPDRGFARGAALPDVVRWLAARCRDDRRIAAAVWTLAAVAAVLIGLHGLRFLLRHLGHPDGWLANNRFALNHDDSIAVLPLAVEAAALAVAAAAVAVRHASAATRLVAAVAVLVALAKLFKPHILVGEALAHAARLAGGLGLNGVQVGKIVAELGLGALGLLLALLAVAVARDREDRLAARLGLGLVLGLAAAGFAGDLAYMLLAGRIYGSGFVLALVEGGGELAVLGFGLVGFLALALQPAGPRSMLASRSGTSSSKLRIAEDSALP